MNIAIYLLGKGISNFNKEFHDLKCNNITKTNKMSPFYYRDLIHYIKTQNLKIPILENKTKLIYSSISGKSSENYNVFGEKKLKDEIQNLDF